MSESTYGSYFTDFKETIWDDSSNNGGFGAWNYVGESADKYLMDGYLFYPDGSGAIFEFSDLYTATNKPNVFWSGKIYGQDYAYQEVGGQNKEIMRMPVYGVVENLEKTRVVDVEVVIPEYPDPITGITTPETTVVRQQAETYYESRGFLRSLKRAMLSQSFLQYRADRFTSTTM